VRLVAALLAGEKVDVRRATTLLGVKTAAATKQLKAIESLPGVICDRKAGRKVWSYVSLPATWGTASIVAACFGSSLAPLFKGTAYQQSLAEVRSRIIGGARRPERFKNIDRKFWFHCQGGDVAIDSEDPLLDEIVDALIDEKMVRLTYVDSLSKRTDTLVGPLALVLYQHQLYLLAQRADGSVHPFRLSRIRAASAESAFNYPHREQFDPAKIFEHSLGIWIDAGEPVEIAIRLRGVWANYALRHRWHSSQVVTLDGESVIVRLRCRLCREIDQWVLGFGEDAEVLSPPDLRSRIGGRIRDLAARYPSTGAGAAGS
jgi:predicted DNA-binding transcriptional regulator YafY